MTVHDYTLFDMLEASAERFGDGLALVTESGEERSFRQLHRRVECLATGLSRAGLGAGDRLSVLALNSAAYLELYLACAATGTVVYPLNWRLSADEIDRLLERTGPKGLVVDEASRSVLPKALPATLGDGLRLQIGGGEPDDGFRALEELYAGEPSPRSSELGGDAPFAVLATAAVEVVPRGAILTHRNLLAANLQKAAKLGLGPPHRYLLALPLFHISALGHALAFLHAGAANVVMPRFEADQAVALIDRHRVTHLSDFPPVLNTLLDAADLSGSKLDSLQYVSGLDSPETIARLHNRTGAEFWTGFGQAETSGLITFQPAAERPGASGKAGALCRIRIVDDYDRPVAPGASGEILVRGPLVFAGYDGEPELTAHTFRGGWHHTGDVGRLDEDGYLHYVKRKAEKELIKPGGENVYPAEVESVILELEGVSAACVFGVPDPKWGEAIHAVVETAGGGGELNAAAVVDHVGGRIARFKKPHHVSFSEALPRNDDGSVDRDSVRERWGRA